MRALKKFFTRIGNVLRSIKEIGFRPTMRIVTVWVQNSGPIVKYKKKKIVQSTFPSEAQMDKQRKEKFTKDITVSILVPLYNTPEKFLRDVIESVEAQTYQKWELCLADGSDEEHSNVGDIASAYASKDPRIKYEKLTENTGISGNTNECARMASGNYLALLDHDDILHPCAVYESVKAICENNADMTYTDEATFKGNDINDVVTFHFKPDFSIDNLRANNYICHFMTFRRELFDKIGGFRKEYDGSQDHDLTLRLTLVADKIVHVDKLLYFWRCHEGSVSENIDVKQYAINAGINAVKDYLASQDIEASVGSTDVYPTIYRIKYKIYGTPSITIIIPNRNHRQDLEKCITSILSKTSYSNYKILVIENGSTDADIKEYYSKITADDRIEVINWDKKEFNYSAINNYAVERADGDYLLFLNNDTEVIEENWLQEMLMFAQREDVGAVGAKLYMEGDYIQHSWIVIGVGEDRVAAHSHAGVPGDSGGYMGRLMFNQDVSAVTGACMMVAKDKFIQAGGFDEQLAVAYNDVDLCLKLRATGFINVFTPFARLYHYESVSRGSDHKKKNNGRFKKEAGYFRTKWAKELEQGDPYYNRNFSIERPYMFK